MYVVPLNVILELWRWWQPVWGMENDTQVVGYADELAVLARSRGPLDKAVKTSAEEAENRGLMINQNKTKYMICTNKDMTEINT